MIEEIDYTGQAASIDPSGRWEAFDKKVVALNKDPKAYTAWRARVISGLSATMLKEYKKLKEANALEDNYLPSIAFHARNLLELYIWASYVVASEENARRFYLDSSIDPMDLVKRAEQWGKDTGQNDEWMEGFPDAKQRLIANAALEGEENLDGKYNDVGRVASELSQEIGKIYSMSNKILSKHTHPTAWIIMMFDNPGMIAALRKTLFNNGCWLFIGVFETLEKHVDSIANSEQK